MTAGFRRPCATLVRRTTPTRKELREARIANLQRLAESIGLGWGGVARGGLVTLYWPGAKYPNIIRGVPVAERWLLQWKTWYDNPATAPDGWYEWNIVVYSHADDEPGRYKSMCAHHDALCTVRKAAA